MIIVTVLMNVGTMLSLISTIPQFIAVWKNREALRGYSVSGSLLLTLAMTSFGSAFVFMGNWFSFLCNVPIAIFWAIACFYSYKSQVKHRKRST